MNNAIETNRFTYNEGSRINKRRELKIENRFVVGHIGRFNTPKNHGFLVEIFKEIYTLNPNAVLLLVGDGELKKTIEKKAYKLGLYKNIIFTGVRSDIPELLHAMDVFYFHLYTKGYPLH